MRGRMLAAVLAALLALGAPAATAAPKPAPAAPKPAPPKGVSPKAAATAPIQVETDEDGEEEEDAEEETGPGEPMPYAKILEALRYHTPQDTAGNGVFASAQSAYEEGRFDEALQLFRQFGQQYPRNLNVNEALETFLLISNNREFKDEPLRMYAAARAWRRAGRADSAAAIARAGLARFPGARIRHHWSYLLAEIARDRGDHAGAVAFALAVADTSTKSRLAPYALKLAAEETLAIGAEPSRALRYYQDLLERYPDSPLAPEVRVRALGLRKKLQL